MAIRESLIIAAGTVFLGSPAMARDTIDLQPTTAWNMHYEDDSCVLIRQFGEGESIAYLQMRKFAPGPKMQIVISTNATSGTSRDFKYRFDSSQSWADANGFHVEMGSGIDGVIFETSLLSDEALAQMLGELGEEASDWENDTIPVLMVKAEERIAAETDSIWIKNGFKDELVLQTGPLDGPIKAMQACTDDLLREWGINQDTDAKLTRRPEPKNIEYLGRSIPYPPQMLRRGMPGMVNLRLSVDDKGGVSECHVQMPLSDPQFEETACRSLKAKLKFDPALDADGNAVASYWTNTVVFRMQP